MMTTTEQIVVTKNIFITPWDNPDYLYLQKLILGNKYNRLEVDEALDFAKQSTNKLFIIRYKQDDVAVDIGVAVFDYDEFLKGYCLHFYRDEDRFAEFKVGVKDAIAGMRLTLEYFFKTFGESCAFVTQTPDNRGSINLCNLLGFSKVCEVTTKKNIVLNLWVKGAIK